MIRLRHLVLPLLVLAFTGIAVSFLQPIFTLKVRWVIVGLAFLYLLFVGELGRSLRRPFAQLSAVFAVWCLMTSLWSTVPILSYTKTGAFCLVAWTGLAIGEYWVRTHSLKQSLSFLYLLTAVTFVAAVFGRYSTSAVVDSGATKMYQGMVVGPNMFGSMVAMSAPALVAGIAFVRRGTLLRPMIMLLSLVFAYYLLASASRGAFLVAACTVAGACVTLKAGNKFQLTLLAIACVGAIAAAVTDLPERLMQFVYKNATTDQGLLHTRAEVWKESWELAQQGGVLGGGYGVTIGQTEFQGGLTAIGYGREKGNSQLAIIEETGWIGFVLYLLGVFTLFSMLFQKLRVTPAGEQKVLLGIVSGLLLGMTLHSVFEAWLVAPGAPESMYFWIMAGVATGLVYDPRIAPRGMVVGQASPQGYGYSTQPVPR